MEILQQYARGDNLLLPQLRRTAELRCCYIFRLSYYVVGKNKGMRARGKGSGDDRDIRRDKGEKEKTQVGILKGIKEEGGLVFSTQIGSNRG